MDTRTNGVGSVVQAVGLMVLAFAIALSAAMLANSISYAAYAEAHATMVAAKMMAKPLADVSTAPLPRPAQPWDF